MPKEFVHGCNPVLATTLEPVLPGEPLPEHLFMAPGGEMLQVVEEGLVSVGWSVGLESVQVTTLTRAVVSHEVKQEGPYIDLDRRGINDYIRNLRRARDQAYGKDE